MSKRFFTFFDFSTSRQLTSELARPLQLTFQTCSNGKTQPRRAEDLSQPVASRQTPGAPRHWLQRLGSALVSSHELPAVKWMRAWIQNGPGSFQVDALKEPVERSLNLRSLSIPKKPKADRFRSNRNVESANSTTVCRNVQNRPIIMLLFRDIDPLISYFDFRHRGGDLHGPRAGVKEIKRCPRCIRAVHISCHYD
jgi:hypothetical protein